MSDPVYGLFVKSNNLCQALYTGYIYMLEMIPSICQQRHIQS